MSWLRPKLKSKKLQKYHELDMDPEEPSQPLFRPKPQPTNSVYTWDDVEVDPIEESTDLVGLSLLEDSVTELAGLSLLDEGDDDEQSI